MNTQIIKSSFCNHFSHAFLKTDRKSCLEVHTQNVSAHNYILELNKLHYMWKMTEIKHVKGECMFSFLLFLFLSQQAGGWDGAGACLGLFTFMSLLWNQAVCVKSIFKKKKLWIRSHEVTKFEQLQRRGGWAGRGGGLYCYIIQCRFMSNTTNKSTHFMIHEEKERERMGIELNEQREKMILHNSVGFLLCFCEDSALVSIFFLSERVRVTVRAGASLSLTCVREASKRQLPVNWSAGRLGAARHWVKSSEVRRSCVSCRWRLGG